MALFSVRNRNSFLFNIIMFAALSCGLHSCVTTDHVFKRIPPGMWRGTLNLSDEIKTDLVDEKGALDKGFKFDEVTDGELPFNFEVTYVNDSVFYIDWINGSERIKTDSINYGWDKKVAKDTMNIFFPVYDTYIHAVYEDGGLKGEFINLSKENYKIPFKALSSKDYRFTTLKKQPVYDMTGKWPTSIGTNDSLPSPAIGEFVQTGNGLTATFRTETGDLRYMEGTVQADKFYLSRFDGSQALLIEGKLSDKDHYQAILWSGKNPKEIIEGHRDSLADLRDPDSLTSWKKDYILNFSFVNEKGNRVSLNDTQYLGKPKVIQISGTWCPNCQDETRFMVDYLRHHSADSSPAVIGLFFERYGDTTRALKALSTYKAQLDIPYQILYAGKTGKDAVLNQLPFLNNFMAFPTTIFLDRKNNIVKIHTGFDGPATSEFEAYKNDFHKTILKMLE